MRYSENYELNLVEGSDIVNPLVQDVPNYEAIDAAMFNNKEHSVGVATELKTGTVHALTRQNEDAAVFRFTATSDYTAGDTFEVDGVQVSALLVDGTALPNRCYIIGSEVLASLKGTLLTVYANRTTASDSDKLGGQLPAYYASDADLDTLKGVVDAHTNQISQINSDLSVSGIIINGTNSAGSPVVTRSAYQKMYITLQKGTYVVVGRLIFNDTSDNTGWRKICLATSPSDDTPQVTVNAVVNSATGLQVSAIFSLNSDTTIYMNAQHSSTANSELGILSRSLTAVRLK